MPELKSPVVQVRPSISRGQFVAYLLVFLSLISICSIQAQQADPLRSTPFQGTGLEQVLTGTWGTGPAQLGVRFPEPGVLPAAPFQGPGGFQPTEDGRIWVSDSVNSRLIGFGSGAATIVPVTAKALGDLEILSGKAFVCTLEPNGIAVIDLEAGKQITHLPVPFKNPSRLFAATPDRLVVNEPGTGIWTIIQGKAEKHPATALEPIGSEKLLYGTLFDFDPSSRKIIQAEWRGENDEPALFAFFQVPGETIVYSRLYGMLDGTPILGLVSASAPQELRFAKFDAQGKSTPLTSVPLLDGPSMPSNWVVGPDRALYGMSGDIHQFRVHRRKL